MQNRNWLMYFPQCKQVSKHHLPAQPTSLTGRSGLTSGLDPAVA
jgi:hypothetical protein